MTITLPLAIVQALWRSEIVRLLRCIWLQRVMRWSL
jgi:hypothetical protein